MKIDNQQQSPDEGNVQRLEQMLVPLNGETENTLTSKIEGEDIVQNLRSLNKLKNRDLENEKQVFLSRAYKKFGNKFTFDLSNYSGITKNKVKITCSLHGTFEQVPCIFLQAATGCKDCGFEKKNKSKTKDFTNFLAKATHRYNNYYEYPESNLRTYKNRKSKVTIICPKHGKFIKSGQKHLSGQSCWECKVEQLVRDNLLVGGYSEDLFKRRPELKLKAACLYYISINEGRLYKIGISTSIKTRMRGIRCKAKTFIKSMDLLWTSEGTLYDCFKKEQEILERYKDARVYFKWSTELFNKNVLPIQLNKLN